MLAISTGCRFCVDSSPFYRRLGDLKRESGDLTLIAVMPQSEEEGRAYLAHHKISVDEVRHIDLSEISVKVTPTLIEVDETGAALNSWTGRLASELEAEVVKNIFGQAGGQ